MFGKNEIINDDILKQTIESNVLNRNSKLITLAKLLSNININAIISIDGRWGTGKTYFVKQFKYIVEHIDDYNDNKTFNDEDKNAFKKIYNNSLIVYYNAWKNDSHTNVLESLIYNILNEYPKMKNQITNFEDFKKKFKKICRDIIYKKTNELIDINNFDELKTFKDLANEIITIEEKQRTFDELINSIIGNKNRLILIVDELDRCKPSFAIELLETIKHFYCNDKITVIVSTNNYELSNTIKNYYGSNFDGFGYLNKFYDSIISLDRINIKNYLQQQLGFYKKTLVWHDFSYLIMMHYNFSLRECNRFVTMYNMVKSYIENDRNYFGRKKYIETCIIIPIALTLKIKDINKYNDFINKKGEKILLEFLEKEVSSTKYESWIRDLENISLNDDYKQKVVDIYYEVFENEEDYYKFPLFEAISMLGTNLLLPCSEETN